jgi:NarL family two-component system response regulator LiaR
MQRTGIVLDRHPLWLEAICPVLEKIGICVVGKAVTPSEALDMIEQEEPDVLVADTGTSDTGWTGLECIRQALRVRPELKVIVLAGSANAEDVVDAFDAGALAYVVKTAHPDDIASAVRQSFESSMFLANGHKQSLRSGAPHEQNGDEDEGRALGLTRRELEILQLVAKGYSNGQLARMLWVTEQTVKFHLSNIYRKLDVSNRTEAASWAHTHRIVALEAAQAS